MGLSLVLDDFVRVARFPKAFFVSTILQMISLPIIAFAIASGWHYFGGLSPELAIGLVILAACPGGVTSNLLTHLGKGDAALSVTLTAVVGMVSFLTVPVIVNLSLRYFYGATETVQLPILKTSLGIFAITSVPVVLGMLVKHFRNRFADKAEPWARKVATVLLVLIVIMAVAEEWKLLTDDFFSIGPAVLTLNLSAMVFAALMVGLFRLDRRQSIAITLECGLQNGSVAVFIALTLLSNKAMMIPAGLYSIMMFVTIVCLHIGLAEGYLTPQCTFVSFRIRVLQTALCGWLIQSIQNVKLRCTGSR